MVLGYVLNDAETTEYEKMKNEKAAQARLLPYPYGRFLAGNFFSYYIFERRINSIWRKNEYKDYVPSLYRGEHMDKHIATLEKLIALVQEDSKMIIILFPNIVSFENYPYLHIHTIIKGVAERNDVVFIDLFPELKEMDHRKLKVSAYDAHPNEIVHKIAADNLYNCMVKNKMLP